MKRLYGTAVAAMAVAIATPAMAAPVYMTGTNNPWSDTSPDDAMDMAFGTGNWTKVNGFDAAILSATNPFVYLDGGDGTAGEFNSFVSGNAAAINAYLNAGGRLLINAARWDSGAVPLSFPGGLTLASDQFSATGTLTADGLTAGLDGSGAGTSWTGNWFSHDVVTGGTCYVTGSAGCTFAGGAVGAGALFVGGQTSPYFQSSGAAALRANELNFAANFGVGAVPEPATWAMMIFGFGAVGFAMRRRKVTTSVRYA